MQSRADIEITLVPLELVPAIWSLAEFHIARGTRAAGLPLHMEIERIGAGMDNLWIICDGVGKIIGAFVTTLCDEGGRRFIGVSNLSGIGARKWAAKLSSTMAEFARANGCDFVRCYGKRGWTRLLPEASIVGERAGHMLYERAA